MTTYSERGSGRSNERPMYLQRPTSGTSQDVSHVLARTFRDLFTRDVVSPETVKNLETSRGGGDNSYHQRYVQALQEVQQERERRIAEAAMLERHIMQAQARAMSADEREMNRLGAGSNNMMYADLGLPPARAHFRSVIDNELLKKHNLICPDDFSTEQPAPVPPPKAPNIPDYAQETASFKNHISGNFDNERDTDMLDEEGNIHLSSDTMFSKPELLSSANLDDESAFNKQHAWKDQLSTDQRMVNRADLANVQAKANYLKNPRFRKVGPDEPKLLIKSQKKIPKEFCIKPKPVKKQVEETVIFVPSPPVVRFTDYHVGQVYELSVELKNVTTSLRQCRVIPPSTTYFSIGLGQFPGEQGLVAPGMSCRYSIRFIPDSLGDYDDFITVQTQAAEPLVIRIEARRLPPIISLPPDIDLGQCLVGGIKIVQLKVHNAGGAGRFCLIDRATWPSTSFKSAVQSGSVSLEPFEIRPPMFELLHNESALIEIKFSPDSVQEFSKEFVMSCDNCHVQYFTLSGQGQTASVEFTTIEGGASDAVPGEMCDVGACQLVRFPNLNPYTYMQKNMVISNPTLVDLPFHWNIIKPHLQFPDPENPQSMLPRNRVLDSDSPFTVEPANGVLKAGEAAQFKVTFAPPAEKTFHSCLHMILENIPELNSNNSNVISPMAATGTGSLCSDVTVLEIEVKGESIPFDVLLQPYAVLVPGKLLMGTTVRREFVMTNNSLSPVVFQWSLDTESHILQVEPPMGELLPGSHLQFQLSITGAEPGKIDNTLLCYVEHLEEPLTLHVSADIKGPDITIDNPDVNFGLISLGECACDEIVVRNNCQIVAKWNITECCEFATAEEEMAISEFTFTPPFGELKPLEVAYIKVAFNPNRCRSVRTVFQLQVEDGNETHISARAEVQLPKACFVKSHLEMSEVFLEVPTQHKITLVNQTRLATKFQFLEPIGSNADLCTLMVEPVRGDLAPREERTILVNFTPHKTMEFKDLRIPCQVDGMDAPLALALFCDVKGLSVNYRVCLDKERTKDTEELQVDFGNAVTLGENVKRFVCIRNNSAITAPFTVAVENFYARPPTPPSDKNKGAMPTKSQRRSILGKTPNLADPLSKSSSRAHAELCAMMLKEGKGAAFTVEPAHGMLHPFSEEVVEITSYSDMWGQYSDRLVCRVENLDLVYIPLSMTVVGCPLVFQMTSTQGNAQPVLRFGTHVSGVSPITRQMRINNCSPYDIRIDWQVFNTVQEDSQSLDFILTYGTPFPLKDAKGNEIIPTDKPSPVHRLPTDCIPNSPDTAATFSRKPTLTTGDLPEACEVKEDTAPRDKVISVNLRSHDGVRAEQPFRFTPSQMVVPARGFTSVAVCLSPHTDTESPLGEEFSSFALGYISLEDQAASVPGKVTRTQHYDLEPICLNITAHVKPALLTLECAEDEGMRYRTALSDLFNQGQLMAEALKINSVNMSNKTGTPLNFKLVAPQPFALTSIDPRTHEMSDAVQEIDGLSLTPHHNFQIHVAFRISVDLLECEGQEGVEVEVAEMERKLHFKKDLLMVYNNGSVQRLPLHATLAVPSFHLSKESVDFGTCLVGQERHLQVTLSNYSASATSWSTKIESHSDTCSVETFKITPNCGLLEGHITHVSNSKCLLTIKFTAKDSELYESVFIFKGILGEEPKRLFVKGQGSYDEKHEAMVNI